MLGLRPLWEPSRDQFDKCDSRTWSAACLEVLAGRFRRRRLGLVSEFVAGWLRQHENIQAAIRPRSPASFLPGSKRSSATTCTPSFSASLMGVTPGRPSIARTERCDNRSSHGGDHPLPPFTAFPERWKLIGSNGSEERRSNNELRQHSGVGMIPRPRWQYPLVGWVRAGRHDRVGRRASLHEHQSLSVPGCGPRSSRSLPLQKGTHPVSGRSRRAAGQRTRRIVAGVAGHVDRMQ
jgi:hypothetical protein